MPLLSYSFEIQKTGNEKMTRFWISFFFLIFVNFVFPQSAPDPCYNYPTINPSTYCFIDPSGSPGTCTEGSPCGSFQQAIDALCTHVAAQPGTYSGAENRDLTAGSLAHIAANGDLGSVIIDLEGLGKFITFDSTPTGNVSIVNVIIENGFHQLTTAANGGGAVQLLSRTFIFVNVIFRNHLLLNTIPSTNTRGGGFFAVIGVGFSGTICGCTFENCNVTSESNLARGGGFFVAGFDLFLWGNAFVNNTASSIPSVGSGAGIFYNGNVGLDDVTMENCRFCDNTASDNGAAVLVINSDASVFQNNVFLRNVALGSTEVANGVNATATFDFVGGAITDNTIQSGTTYLNNVYQSNAVLGVNSGGGAITFSSGFNSATSGGERFCNNTAANATVLHTDNDISYDASPSQFQCNSGDDSIAIAPGSCTGGCVFLSDGNCDLCTLPQDPCEALLVLPPVCILLSLFFSFFFLFETGRGFFTINLE